MSFAGRRVLVTGSDGFIGSHVVEELVRGGADVRAFVLYNSFNSWGWLEHVPPDVKDASKSSPATSATAHCMSRRDEGLQRRDASGGADRDPVLLSRARHLCRHQRQGHAQRRAGRARPRRARASCTPRPARSTAPRTSFRSPKSIRCRASRPTRRPRSAPTRSRLSFHASFDTPVVVIRPFNTYGPRQSARAVIPTIITQIAAGHSADPARRAASRRATSHSSPTPRAGSSPRLTAPAEQVRRARPSISAATSRSRSATPRRMIAEVMGASIEIERRAGAAAARQGSEVERLWADNTQGARAARLDAAVRRPRRLRAAGLAETVAWFCDPANLAATRPTVYNI